MTLVSDGYVRFTDPEAAACFREFSRWASEVSAAPFADTNPEWHEIARHYYWLQSLGFPDAPDVVLDAAPAVGAPIAVWVDPSRYAVSEALLDGFFTGRKNFIGDVITRVRDWRHSWVDRADRMRDETGAFSPQLASEEVEQLAIDLQLTDQGSFVTARTSDGRHRTVAMIALKAPVMPVRLYL